MNNSVTTIVESTPLDLWISAWLHEKMRMSNSKKTMEAYSTAIYKFRSMLRSIQIDLNSLSTTDEYYPGITYRQALRLKAEEFSTYSEVGRTLQPTTVNQRLAIISSFYEYCVRHEYLSINPIRAIGRADVLQYQSSRALSPEQTETGLAQINRETLKGKRDYAILSVLLSTGKRLSEVANLERKDLSIDSRGIVTMYFEHCKGNKVLMDELPEETSRAVIVWVKSFYGPNLNQIKPSAPLWVSLGGGGRSGSTRGHKLSIRSFANICEQYFNTSKVHSTRHTWTVNMIKEGAPLQLIKTKLGHGSLATTGIYADSLQQNDNPFAARIAQRAGIK